MKEDQILIYQNTEGNIKVDVRLEDETVWLTQKAMAELFGVGVPAISKHLSNIFESGELQKEVVISKMETTTKHGAISGKTQTKLVEYYKQLERTVTGYFDYIESLGKK